MLHCLMNAHPDFRDRFTVIFENTGREHEATLDFVHEVEAQWDVPVIWLEYTRVPAIEIAPALVKEGKTQTNLITAQREGLRAHWWKVVNFRTASRRGDEQSPFDELLAWASVLPNVRSRMCSVQLKTRTRDRYIYSQGIRDFYSYIGIRQDEAHRVDEIMANIRPNDFEQPVFPLVDGRTNKATVDAFWAAQPFRLNIPNLLGNCDFCFLKARFKRAAIAKTDPVAAMWWANWEEFRQRTTTGDGGLFDRRKSVASFLADADQPELSLQVDESEQDVPCSCAVGGYRGRTDQDELCEVANHT
jgi:3'-phosphoadenosine 5'-phosphosulfate sulfotransferase (PAPS reductase)/FAD synthetase